MRGGERTAGIRIARRLRRQRTARRRHGGEIERGTGPASARRADRLLGERPSAAGRRRRRSSRACAAQPGAFGCCDGSNASPRRPGVPVAAGHDGAGRACGRGWRGERALPALFLHAADVGLELLVAVLQLLDDPGELPDLGFKAIDAHHQVGTGRLADRCPVRSGPYGDGGAALRPPPRRSLPPKSGRTIQRPCAPGCAPGGRTRRPSTTASASTDAAGTRNASERAMWYLGVVL